MDYLTKSKNSPNKTSKKSKEKYLLQDDNDDYEGFGLLNNKNKLAKDYPEKEGNNRDSDNSGDEGDGKEHGENDSDDELYGNDYYKVNKDGTMPNKNGNLGQLDADAVFEGQVNVNTTKGDPGMLNAFRLTCVRCSRINRDRLVTISNKITAPPESIKFVRVKCRAGFFLNDNDMNNIGTLFGAKMGHVEYLSFDLFLIRSVTVAGIMKLINAFTGNMNTIKSLRLSLRRMRWLKLDDMKTLIAEIRRSLVNLEELSVMTAGNLRLHNVDQLRDEGRMIEGLGLGLKKYSYTSYTLGITSIFKDDATSHMKKYIQKTHMQMGRREGMIGTQKMIMYFDRLLSNRNGTEKVSFDKQKFD